MNKLLKRSIFGLLYVAIIVTAVVLVPVLLAPVAIIAMLGMLFEYFKNSAGAGGFKIQKGLLALSASLFFALSILSVKGLVDSSWIWVSFISLSCIIPVQLFSEKLFEFETLAEIVLGFLWICLPFAALPYLIGNVYDPFTLMSFFILIWGSDVGAYCLGSLLGQRKGARKLAPHISPNKSWWGVAGGTILCVIAALVLMSAGWLKLPWWHAVSIGIIICAASVIGDLFESLWKRHAGIKDSGNVIPGHGGLLDRLDSSLLAIPIAYIYLTLFKLIQ